MISGANKDHAAGRGVDTPRHVTASNAMSAARRYKRCARLVISVRTGAANAAMMRNRRTRRMTKMRTRWMASLSLASVLEPSPLDATQAERQGSG